MSYMDDDWYEPAEWYPAPDPNRQNYYMVKLQNQITKVIMFYPIHANATGTEGQPGYISALEAAIQGAETLNPGWKALFAHHQWQSKGVFGTGGPRD